MGAWGPGLYQDDIALDVKDEYIKLLKLGKSNEEAYNEMLKNNAWIADIEEEETPMFWFALADTQWRLGRLKEEVKDIALSFIEEGRDLERWQEDKKQYEKRKKILSSLKEKLNSPQPKEKRIPKPFKCPWNLYDVYAYKIESEEAKKEGYYGRYLILIKIDEYHWSDESVTPILLCKITKDNKISADLEEINECEFIQTRTMNYNARILPIIHDEEEIKKSYEMWNTDFPTDEFGQLPVYRILIGAEGAGFRKIKNKLVFLGNYPNFTRPKNEFIPIDCMCYGWIFWHKFENSIIKNYEDYNKRKNEIYKRKRSDEYKSKLSWVPESFYEAALEYKRQKELKNNNNKGN